MEPTRQQLIELGKLTTLQEQIGWMRAMSQLGALICSFWLMYRAFHVHGFLAASGVFVFLSIIYRFGASPLFAVAASILCYQSRAVGIWLPLLSYVFAAVLLYVDLRVDRLRRTLAL